MVQQTQSLSGSLSHVWLPEWPAPANVKAVMTTRHRGMSLPPFDSFNLGDHVRDDSSHVATNRQHLAAQLGARPVFLSQVHGVQCMDLGPDTPNGIEADACVTRYARLACTVMVADCLPVLLCDVTGRTVGAAHAGWRGLVGAGGACGEGVLAGLLRCFIDKSIDCIADNASIFDVSASEVDAPMAWLGPCIGPQAFEVGSEVRAAFLSVAPHFAATAACFEAIAGKAGFFRCNLAGLARLQLAALGINRVYGNDGSPAWCTVSQSSIWFSHRRDAARLGSTGRMAACIWLD